MCGQSLRIIGKEGDIMLASTVHVGNDRLRNGKLPLRILPWRIIIACIKTEMKSRYKIPIQLCLRYQLLLLRSHDMIVLRLRNGYI